MKVEGTVTIAIHMRDLTQEEKAAHVANNLDAVRS
jgi:hypothetical protein